MPSLRHYFSGALEPGDPRQLCAYLPVTRPWRQSLLRLTTILACLTLAAPAKAQQYSSRYYGAEDGLTNAAVKVLLHDRTGFVWAGTENGVFRYDGQRFRRYGSAEG